MRVLEVPYFQCELCLARLEITVGEDRLVVRGLHPAGEQVSCEQAGQGFTALVSEFERER